MEAVRVKPESWIQDIISYSAECMRVKTEERTRPVVKPIVVDVRVYMR